MGIAVLKLIDKCQEESAGVDRLGYSSCLDPRTDMFSPILCVEKGQHKLQSDRVN